MGVCEVPGWGHQLAPARVLAEMRDLGLAATEFGPDGFLSAAAAERAALLAEHGLRAVGGFAPVVLHDPGRDPLPEVRRILSGFGVERSNERLTVVLAAVTGLDGYDERPALDAAGWAALLGNLDRIDAAAAEIGVRAVLHPHVGTMVERSDEVRRVLDGSGIPLCLDTGHLLIGGIDPGELAARAPGRIAHVHLKDVDAGLAGAVQDGRTPTPTPSGTASTARSARATSTSPGSSAPRRPSLRRLVRPRTGHDHRRGARARRHPLADVRACVDFLAGIPA